MTEKQAPHVDLLKKEFAQRMAYNTQYSLRSYARNLGVAPSWLSSFLNAKKGISLKRAQVLLQNFDWTRQQQDLFLTSVSAHFAKSPKTRQIAKAKLMGLLKEKRDAKRISSTELKKIRTWYHLAILELIEIEGFDHSFKWLAKRLNLPMKLVEFAVNDLVQIGWLQITDGKMISVHNECESEMDMASDDIKIYHQEIIKKTQTALACQAVDEREFLNMTLAFDSKKMADAKEFIRSFQIDFARKFYSAETTKDSVYQLSVYCFRLDQKNEGDI